MAAARAARAEPVHLKAPTMTLSRTGQPAERAYHLEGAPDAGAARKIRSQAGDVAAGKPDRTGVRAEYARNQVEDRRLARAVWTNQADDRAGLDREAYALNRLQAAEALGNALDLEQRRAHGLPSASLKRFLSQGHRPAGCSITISSSAAP